MAEEKILLTQQNYDDIVKDHEKLITEGRQEVAEHLKFAKSLGDLSENSEYDQAKEDQVKLEEKIAKLEYMIRNAQIVSEDELSGDHVNLGHTVKIKDLETKEKFTYTIVGITDADPFAEPVAKISNESPVGKALLGKKKNEKIEVDTPDGTRFYQIMEISR